MTENCYIGIDFGTSGCRAMAIDRARRCIAEADIPLPPSRQEGAHSQQEPQAWWHATGQLMPRLLRRLNPDCVRAICVDGTSGSVFLADSTGHPVTPALMYNDNRAVTQAKRIGQLAPRDSAAHGTGSGLAKLLWLLEHYESPANGRVHTQSDWVSSRLSGRYGICDANNALKLGYAPEAGVWPEWLQQLSLPAGILPEVVEPGVPLAPIVPSLAEQWGLRKDVIIISGTTDSTAAFIASGASRPGEAVTSLGSTLVCKVISEHPIFAPDYGVYSQPLGQLWLVGGGSNSGGAVLRHYFSDEQMAQLSQGLQPGLATGLNYYPLLKAGERFPYNDPQFPPRLSPRPHDDLLFFQGMLEGIAAIEKAGYERLHQLGAPYPISVRSNGGGAGNRAWTDIRSRLLGVPMLEASSTEACFGAALLATKGING